jgi:hypothetical protein
MAATRGNGVKKGNGTKQRRASTSGVSSYDRFKEFQGKRYTGMAVGRRHRWQYQAGDWMEKKVTPDKWEFTYAVKKQRAGKAPEGSGAPVGTAYHWYILADQIVTKQDANSYTTEMAGLKYKLSHKRAEKSSWSASDRAQRKRLVQILREMIADLEKGDAARPQPAALQAADQRAADGKPTPSSPRKRRFESTGSDGARSARPARSQPAPASRRGQRTREPSRPPAREKRAAP